VSTTDGRQWRGVQHRDRGDRTRRRYRPTFPLMGAKLVPPTPPPGVVSRAQLISLLQREPRASTVSLVAPAGYGKTLLLAEWVASDAAGRRLADDRRLR
jgi:hypothetical protein